MRVVLWFGQHVTFRRWNHNPFQMWMLLCMLYVSINQLAYVPDSGTVSELVRQSQLWLVCCNLFGGVIVMSSLHMRDKILGTWIELSGYVALTGSMGLYVWLVMSVSTGPNTSFGLGLSQAFVLASIHRAILIGIDKGRAEWRYRRREELHRERLRNALQRAGLSEDDLHSE